MYLFFQDVLPTSLTSHRNFQVRCTKTANNHHPKTMNKYDLGQERRQNVSLNNPTDRPLYYLHSLFLYFCSRKQSYIRSHPIVSVAGREATQYSIYFMHHNVYCCVFSSRSRATRTQRGISRPSYGFSRS